MCCDILVRELQEFKIEGFSFQEPLELYKHVGQLLHRGMIISCEGN